MKNNLSHNVTGCLYLPECGVSLYNVKELLGHQDYSTTQIHSHLSNNSLEDAVNKI